MDTFEAIEKRRSVKAYDATYQLTTKEQAKILYAAIKAPTSFNIQHWRFVVLRDPELRSRIRKEFGNDQAQITDASLLLLMTADMKAWAKSPERYWHNAPQEVASLLINWIGPFHEGREWLQRDEAQRSIGMAMQNMMLAAVAMGYQCCPMIGFDIEEVAKLINLPDDHVMGPMLAIGKGTKEPWSRPGQLPLSELVVENGF
jgi:nitroreductase